MVENTELIVLHTTKCSDSALVLHVLTRENGREGVLVRGLGKNSRQMSMFQPLNILEADLVRTPRTTLPAGKNFFCVMPLESLRNNYLKCCMTMFVSEVLFKVLRENMVEPGLYDWCRQQIGLLDAMDSDFNNFHLLFLLGLCGQLGFAPEVEDLMPFAGDSLDKIAELLGKPFAEAMLVRMTGHERSDIAEILIDYLEFHIEAAVNINSLKVLREIFSGI